MVYKTYGTCSEQINIEVENGIIRSVKFIKGCPGFTQALEKILVGMKAEDAVLKLEGIKCLDKGTSCPDQLAKALKLCKDEGRE